MMMCVLAPQVGDLPRTGSSGAAHGVGMGGQYPRSASHTNVSDLASPPLREMASPAVKMMRRYVCVSMYECLSACVRMHECACIYMDKGLFQQTMKSG